MTEHGPGPLIDVVILEDCPHAVCACATRRIAALEAALVRAMFPILVALTWCPVCRGSGQSRSGSLPRCIVCADLRDARERLLATRAGADTPLGRDD